MTYEWKEDEEKLEMVPAVHQNNNNNNNVVSDSQSDKEDKENLFNEDHDKEVKAAASFM